ncbi:MAG: retroviral-like aspartic protease family protein [archaeon YNP-WB-040]|nr:retroviral-like aspartic protease family protein [Candidatus Culexarchaeum yellowstonense]
MVSLGIVRAKVVLRGSKGSREGAALVDTGAAMTVVDRDVADAVGVMYTGKRRTLMSATGHRLEGEVAIVRELSIEEEVLDYEKVLAVRLSEEVKKALRKLDVDDSIIIGITTIELAGFIPDTNTGKLRKIETFLF